MDTDDDSLLTPTPNHFLLSVYKENLSGNMNHREIDENLRTIMAYKCRLCRRIRDNPILICATCVNSGQFYSSKYNSNSNQRRESLLNYEEFQQDSNNKTRHLSCSDQMLLLKKFHSEKPILQSEFQVKLQSSIKTHQMAQDIQVRKNRLKLVHHSIEKLREQIEQKKQLNIKTKQYLDRTRSRIEIIKKNIHRIRQTVESSTNEIQKKIDICKTEEKILRNIRCKRLNEIRTYLFPIQRISAEEDGLAIRIKDLLDAQQTDIDYEVKDDDESIILDQRYQIVNSFLPSDGDYQIDNLVSIYNASFIKLTDEIIKQEIDSPQLSPSSDSYEVLSGLSHACQLINVIAFYLHINLPFRLHQLEFDTNILTIDCLRANIAKLNANIYSSCLVQGVPIEVTSFTYTLENLSKLLTFQKYLLRPKRVIYPENYIDMIEKEVSEKSRASITHYWFDDDDVEENEFTQIINTFEWESIPTDECISNNQSIFERSDTSLTTSSQQQSTSTVMSSSIGFLKTTSSNFVNYFFRDSKP